jgi:hypothetical protein
VENKEGGWLHGGESGTRNTKSSIEHKASGQDTARNFTDARCGKKTLADKKMPWSAQFELHDYSMDGEIKLKQGRTSYFL